jgi:hypothetical protein
MEVKYGNMFDSQLRSQRHRVGARGSATTFLLPWGNILAGLERLEGNAETPPLVPDLPRSGAQLAYVVQVLLETNDEEKRQFLEHFFYQANVNRDKVVRSILGMKARGQRAYVRVGEAKVREKAKQLPSNGIPPGLILLLPNDNSFEKLHVQNAATPAEGKRRDQEILRRRETQRCGARKIVGRGRGHRREAHLCDVFFGQTIADPKLRTARAEVRLQDAGPGSCRCVSGLACPNHVELLLKHVGQERRQIYCVAHLFNIIICSRPD